MKIAKLKIKNFKKGFSMFIAVIIMSALLLITYSVVTISVKETEFSTSNRESQFAYFAADAGVECALYWDTKPVVSKFDPSVSGSPIACGDDPSITTGEAIAGTSSAVTTRIGGGGGGSASIVLVNTATGSNTSGASSISSGAFNAMEDNLIVVAVRYYRNAGQNISSVTDSEGNTYLFAVGTTSTGNDRTEIWYAKNIDGEASNVVTANFSASASYRIINVAQYSGVDIGSPLDATAISTTQTGSTVTSNSFTTTANNEVIVAAAQIANLGMTWTAGSGYTKEVEDSPNRVVMLEDKIVSSVQNNVTVSAVSSNTGSTKTIIVATFKAASGGGGGNPTSVFGFSLNSVNNPSSACAIVIVTKNADGSTYIASYGYNTCNTTDPRRVERGIEVTY